MTFTVAIVGRPNVGKSTLFNRLVGRRVAIVDDTPGVTRDRREGAGRLADLEFRVIDTAGFEEAGPETLQGRMREQTERALADADLALLLIDARAGVTPMDEHFVELVRRRGGPVVLIANKCEGRASHGGLIDAYALGLGEPVALSAEHGEGMAELYAAIAERMRASEESADEAGGGDADTGAEEEPAALRLAIVGRPNVGKSTLVNRLIGEDRLLTGPEAGITRDAIDVMWEWRGRPLQLTDTAGLRRKSRIADRLERLSTQDTQRAIRFAHVVVLVLDGRDMLEKQDLTIARQVLEEGRALIIAANKWDLVEDKREALARLRDRFEQSLPQARGAPVMTVSAFTGERLPTLLDKAFEIYDIWNRRIATGPLNQWLAEATGAHPPPLANGRRIRLRYMTQARTRPPTFVVFASQPAGLPESYVRYLVNGLRDAFGFAGVPLRLHLRKGKNPYASG